MAIAPEIEDALAVYDARAQISPFQMRVIAGVVAQHRFAARFLIHGCGFDSRFWQALNARGRTLFVEHDEAWRSRGLALAPNLEVVAYPELPTSVERSLPHIDAEALAGVTAPGWASETWDIVLIDGPSGYRPQHPGRALPIFWASAALQAKADIFVDDYHRPLERLYCDSLLKTAGRQSAVLPGRDGKQMYWRLGELPAPA